MQELQPTADSTTYETIPRSCIIDPSLCPMRLRTLTTLRALGVPTTFIKTGSGGTIIYEDCDNIVTVQWDKGITTMHHRTELLRLCRFSGSRSVLQLLLLRAEDLPKA